MNLCPICSTIKCEIADDKLRACCCSNGAVPNNSRSALFIVFVRCENTYAHAQYKQKCGIRSTQNLSRGRTKEKRKHFKLSPRVRTTFHSMTFTTHACAYGARVSVRVCLCEGTPSIVVSANAISFVSLRVNVKNQNRIFHHKRIREKCTGRSMPIISIGQNTTTNN